MLRAAHELGHSKVGHFSSLCQPGALNETMRLGAAQDQLISEEECVKYYNRLVDFINSYEGRLSHPDKNCVPQYTVAGLDMPLCLWINLDRCDDRRRNMERLLRGYDHVRIRAVDAKEDHWRALSEATGMEQVARATPGEKCCTLSHLAAFERIAESRTPLALVLEDDVTFKFIPPNFSFADTVADLPEDWDLLHVSARSNPPSKLIDIPYKYCEWRPRLCYSTAAYLVNGAHIDQILGKLRAALAEGKEARADWVIYGSCRTYVLTRPVIDEDPFHFSSAIHTENEVRCVRRRGTSPPLTHANHTASKEYHRRMHVTLSELYANEIRAQLGIAPTPLTYATAYRKPVASQPSSTNHSTGAVEEGPNPLAAEAVVGPSSSIRPSGPPNEH